MRRTLPNRLRTLCLSSGVAAVFVAFAAILSSVYLAPWFTWRGHALSHLGDPEAATSTLYNGGLVLAGLLGALFLAVVVLEARNVWERLGGLVLLVSVLDLALIGVYPVGHPLHGAVSVVFFVSFTYGLFLYGSGEVLAGDPRRGVATVWLGVAHATAWAAWTASGVQGVAVPELAGAVILGVWTVATAVRKLGVRRPRIRRTERPT